jgi:hypothetical protein
MLWIKTLLGTSQSWLPKWSPHLVVTADMSVSPTNSSIPSDTLLLPWKDDASKIHGRLTYKKSRRPWIEEAHSRTRSIERCHADAINEPKKTSIGYSSLCQAKVEHGKIIIRWPIMASCLALLKDQEDWGKSSKTWNHRLKQPISNGNANAVSLSLERHSKSWLIKSRLYFR